jgi:hypothetical protein
MCPLCSAIAPSFADRGEGLGQDVVERLTLGDTVAELGRSRAKRVVGQRLGLVFERVDLRDDLLQSSKLALVGVEETPQDAQGSTAR